MRVQVLFADPAGRARQKIVLRESLPASFCSTVLLQSSTGTNVTVLGYGGYTGHVNALLSASEESMRNHWLPDLSLCVADIVKLDGATHPLCSRSLLKATVSSLRTRMLAARVGIEIELYFIPEPLVNDILSHRFSPRSSPREQYGPLNNTWLDDLISASEQCGIRIESLHREFENLQYEFALAPSDPVQAADDVMIFRELARSISNKHGLFACFMPKPFTVEFGSGMHINVSIQQIAPVPSARNFSATDLQDLYAHFPACCTIWNPTVNSYRRLNGADFASISSPVAEERRDSLLRVVGSGAYGSRVEFRLPDAACNPYCSIALCLSLLTSDAYRANTVAASDVVFPTSLREAIGAFKQDPVVHEVFPLDFRAVLMAQGAEELRCYEATVSDVDYMLNMKEFYR